MTATSLFGDGDSRDAASSHTEEPTDRQPSNANAYGSTVSLYRKYRPLSFDDAELVGQEHIVRTLRNAIALGRVAHAYLFSGPRGTGKTTTARLLAKAVNCLHDDPSQRPCNACAHCQAINASATPDIIEIDAASNRGIDDIRDLRDRVRFAPAQLSSKVYIIDEAHQITGAAANAFLKTLEEPPTHSRFILATTDPEELLPTIVSRCQHFEFRRVGADDVVRRLRTVAEAEGIAATDDALHLIARHATGSLRDALGLLEQLALRAGAAPGEPESPPIEAADVIAALGLSRNDRVEHLVAAIGQRSAGDALRIVAEAIDEGDDARQLNRQLVAYLRLLLIERAGGAAAADDRARALAASFSLAELASLARRFADIDFSIKHSPYPQLPLEIALVEATAAAESPQPREAVDRRERESEAAPIARPTSLRDRVRGASAIREVPASEPTRPSAPEPVPITPLRPERPADAANQARPANTESLHVEQIVDLWPNVRADVKALNRRIEALLSEVDPVAITGNQITLAVPYPFHRDKLNTDDVRETVAGVVSRLVGREVSLFCVLRGEVAQASEPAPAQNPTPSAPSDHDGATPERNGDDPDEAERAQIRLRAAINIFDAEEIGDIAPASQPAPSEGA